MQPIEGRLLNLWNICREGTKALGPGLRYVIWTQGCLKLCPGCTSPESRPIKPKMVVEVDHLAEDIVNTSNLSGITISGGEPFLQAASLAKLLSIVKPKRPEMNVIIFTGYNKEELRWGEANALLNQTDVLIDGPYCQGKSVNRGLRGSSNQRIHFLTNVLDDYREELENGTRKLDLYVDGDEIVTIGIPTDKSNKNI